MRDERRPRARRGDYCTIFQEKKGKSAQPSRLVFSQGSRILPFFPADSLIPRIHSRSDGYSREYSQSIRRDEDLLYHCGIRSRCLGAPEIARRTFNSHLSWLDNLIANRVTHQFADGMYLKLAHDVGAVGFGGLDADTQGGGHFLAAFPL
jgi:hypothetical protein